MTEQAEQPQPFLIKWDIWCPRCNYNLRGLTGKVVNCPECGRRCDVKQLYAMQQMKKWGMHIPGFGVLLKPGCFLFCTYGIAAITVPTVAANVNMRGPDEIGIDLLLASIVIVAVVSPAAAWLYWIVEISRRNGFAAGVRVVELTFVTAGVCISALMGIPATLMLLDRSEALLEPVACVLDMLVFGICLLEYLAMRRCAASTNDNVPAALNELERFSFARVGLCITGPAILPLIWATVASIRRYHPNAVHAIETVVTLCICVFVAMLCLWRWFAVRHWCRQRWMAGNAIR